MIADLKWIIIGLFWYIQAAELRNICSKPTILIFHKMQCIGTFLPYEKHR